MTIRWDDPDLGASLKWHAAAKSWSRYRDLTDQDMDRPQKRREVKRDA